MLTETFQVVTNKCPSRVDHTCFVRYADVYAYVHGVDRFIPRPRRLSWARVLPRHRYTRDLQRVVRSQTSTRTATRSSCPSRTRPAEGLHVESTVQDHVRRSQLPCSFSNTIRHHGAVSAHLLPAASPDITRS